MDKDKIESFVDETPAATLIWQLEKYTKNQLKILHDIPKTLPRKQDLLNLYNRAMSLKDENALSILSNKYGIDRLLFFDDLPNVTDEEVDNTIKGIEDFIQQINPHVGREKIKNRTTCILKNGRYLRYIDYSGPIPTLKARTYLKDLERNSLENAVHYFGISGYRKMTNDELIDAILKHERCKEIILNNIKKKRGIYFKQYVIEYIEKGDYLISTV